MKIKIKEDLRYKEHETPVFEYVIKTHFGSLTIDEFDMREMLVFFKEKTAQKLRKDYEQKVITKWNKRNLFDELSLTTRFHEETTLTTKEGCKALLNEWKKRSVMNNHSETDQTESEKKEQPNITQKGNKS